MIYFTIVFLCTAGVFLFLLEDRFRLWTTLGGTAGTYVLSLVIALILRRMTQDPVLAQQLPCIAGSLLFFLSSLVLYTNNFLQKLFVALLCLCNFTFLGFFIPLLLGAAPFATAGAFAGISSVLVYLLFTVLTGLCLYRPIRYYSDRGVSGFLLGMCLLLLALYLLSLGVFDFLFRTNIPAARLLLAVLLYCAVIFAFRSLYQAGRFRERTASEAARNRMLEMESGDFADMLAAVREVRAAQKAGEYALDTINVMLADNAAQQIPAYISAAKRTAGRNPILEQYHENPYLNAVVATKAAFCAQNEIAFECNTVTGDTPLKTAELCVIVNEMLTRACLDAAGYTGVRRLRFTAFPTGGSLTLEAVYSARLPEQEKFTLKGKKTSDVVRWLLEEDPSQENHLQGLENTEEIIGRYSGKLTVSAASSDKAEGSPEEVILRADLRF